MMPYAILGGIVAAVFMAFVWGNHCTDVEKKKWEVATLELKGKQKDLLLAETNKVRDLEHLLADKTKELDDEHAKRQAEIDQHRRDDSALLARIGGLRDANARCGSGSGSSTPLLTAAPGAAAEEAQGCTLSPGTSKYLLDSSNDADDDAEYAVACEAQLTLYEETLQESSCHVQTQDNPQGAHHARTGSDDDR